MLIHVFTLFPDWFGGVFGDSILARAKERGLLEIRLHNFRDWTTDKHNTVDNAPYGGGAGMVIRAEPLARALDEIVGPPGTEGRPRVLLTSPLWHTLLSGAGCVACRRDFLRDYLRPLRSDRPAPHRHPRG
jgi:tRNA (guanine37-N1)-methyltransferase